jgi:DNA processing protein
MRAVDATTPLGLLALLAQDGVGQARALAVARADRVCRLPTDAVKQAEAVLRHCMQLGVEAVGFFDDRYPEQLRRIPSPPAVLHVRGAAEALACRLVAVVGSRRPTRFGLTTCEAVCGALAERGVGVVSGLALGVAAHAHRRALQLGVTQVAALGCGVDRVHPHAHAEQIISTGGAVVSEQPPGVQATARHLIARNRIQSGPACGVVVCQAHARSGTMHTARFAATQGRPVWRPVPPVGSPHEANRGLAMLLTTPARELPGKLAAFTSARSVCEKLGDRPLASPLQRGMLSEWAVELATPA